jgi:hypothetical protein
MSPMKLLSTLLAATACLALAAGADAKPARKAKAPVASPAPAGSSEAPAEAPDAPPNEDSAVSPEEASPPEDSGKASLDAGVPADPAAAADAPPADQAAPPPDPSPGEGAARDSTAQADAAPAEPPAAPTTVKLPAPVMKAGEKRRFRIVGIDETKGPAGAQTRENDQTIEIEVVRGKGDTRLLRYVIVDSAVKNDPLGKAMLIASTGVATDLETDAAGKPLKLTGWDKVRATILERLLVDPEAPLEGAKRTRTALNSMDGVMAIPFAVPEVLMMSDMQAWPEMEPGRTEDAVATQGTGDREARLISHREAALPAPGACTATLRRVTELDPASPAAKARAATEKLETTAEVSTIDGWVVSLKQVNNQLAGSNRRIRTWTITREDPPACPPEG